MKLESLRSQILYAFVEVTDDDLTRATMWSNKELDDRWVVNTLGQEEEWGLRSMPVLLYEAVRRILTGDSVWIVKDGGLVLDDEELDAVFDMVIATLIFDGFSLDSEAEYKAIFTKQQASVVFRALMMLCKSGAKGSLIDIALGAWLPFGNSWKK